MKALAGLALLLLIVGTSLACASGEAPSEFSETVIGGTIPYDIRNSFKPVQGGDLENRYIPINENFFLEYSEDNLVNRAAIQSGNGEDVTVTSFSMMESEVTVSMFADFMNAIEENFASIEEQTTTEVAGQGDDVTTGTTTAFTLPSTTIYKAPMQLYSLCGIYMMDGSQDVSGEVIETASFYIAGKPGDALPYVDPYENFMSKPRSATENSTIRFIVAPGRENYPMVFVDKVDAKQFARWLGPYFRPPTEQEYQYAARGGKNADFGTSSGNIFREINGQIVTDSDGNPTHLANIQGRFPSNPGAVRVKSFPANGYGLYDLTGNVYEWTVDPNEGRDPTIDGSSLLMGGSFASRYYSVGSTWGYTGTADSTIWAADLGFRLITQSQSTTIAGTEERLFDN